MNLIEGYDLRRCNTFQVGGKAAWAVLPETEEELREALQWSKERKLPFKVLGYGSNVLISDEGYAGVIIMLSKMEAATSFKWIEMGKVWYAGAWVSMKKISNELLAVGCIDMLKLSGIPGTFGGAVKMNAGCFGREVSDVIESVDLMNEEGERKTTTKEGLMFGYRSSAVTERDIVLNATCRTLEFSNEAEIELLRKKVADSRQGQPLGTKNAGSVFKNGSDYFAAKLIDEAGLKGSSIGDAEVSGKHANFIVNRGSATATDIYRLICHVEEKVREKFGVSLQREVELIGVFH